MSASSEKCKLQLCRLCLAHTTTFYSLIKEDDSSAMLESLTSLRILPADEISTVMCLKCRLNLKLAFRIQQNMLRAEQLFREQQFSSLVKPLDEISDDEMTTAHDIVETECEAFNEDEKDDEDPDLVQKQPMTLKTYSCDICGKEKFTKVNLRKHKYNVHVGLKCPICGKEITRTNFKRHVERHDDPLSICELCGATCKSQDLRVHMYRHQKNSYKCQFCNKVYRNKSHQIHHEKREHLDVADFVCDTCGKKFYKAYDLKRHVDSTHLKLRPHICEFCNIGFSSRFALRTHRRRHTNETPFRCDVCGDGFRQKVSLKAHLKSKHNVEEELICECGKCGKKFASKAALIAHSRVH